jgi:hypothetical protein
LFCTVSSIWESLSNYQLLSFSSSVESKRLYLGGEIFQSSWLMDEALEACGQSCEKAGSGVCVGGLEGVNSLTCRGTCNVGDWRYPLNFTIICASDLELRASEKLRIYFFLNILLFLSAHC